MSTASAYTLPHSAPRALGLWLQKGLSALRTTVAKAPSATAPASKSQHQEAEKLRAMARSMMRIDAGYAADMFVAADRHEFGHSV